MPLADNRNRTPLLFALFCILVWGISYAVIRQTVQQIPPLTLACLRHLFGALMLWPLTRGRFGAIRIPARDHLAMCGLGLAGITLYFGFENHGLKLTSASHGALLIALIPLGTELVTALRKRTLPAAATWFGTALALTGVGLLVGQSDGVASLEGDLLMLGAVVSWISYTFGVNRFAGRYPGLLLTRQIMLYGALTLLPGMAWELTRTAHALPDAGAWLGFAYLTVICSVLGYDLWNRAVPRLGPSAVNNLLYLLPLVGVITGVLALSEPVTPALFAGGGLILAGVVLAGRGQRSKAREAYHAD
ncbi:drug/metabolite transporter (DMT)-like permease [Geothermobacter ehrlichii]|uniref:Drug/metabolite transporter (DMT)-like permease n=1 Tax=Geothermobacter ehrlichii TaxID=213224 RepID=A0A5D3WK09_9BACT|nr:DMT family transporter [Geothermobacter ehrlichii]TYO97162.1 drug/metabolite transporter (DMT)-like permease [Geothermobacter ehrlichii]